MTMEPKQDWWWSKDARTHRDNFRCANCGHSTAYHRARGGCSVRSVLGEKCSCRKCVKPTKR